ncbi:FxsA family protein [Thioclava sp. A2]|uniref:FxsA family protein n=1 Tax=Thioclava sp. FCG-A2 TaxID=3080562 RepID=UPI0029533025|nr:FxsA family protein [Thioclava sp. A2]MDV7270663.1 FxsA family protein [Thioclava sp. A2]
MWLFLAFVLVPLIEIGLFIQVGGLIGLWPTLGLVLLTAFVGMSLMRSQGAQALNDLRGSMARLDDPTKPLAHGAMILFAGALLLTPGFFTDATGIALLIPAVREAVLKYLSRRVRMQSFTMGSMHQRPPHQRPHDPQIIDADEIDDDSRPTPGNSGWTRH